MDNQPTAPTSVSLVPRLLRKAFEASPDGKFGALAGVFTPNVLTILGVIMFLRFGQVIGQAGIHDVVIIVLLATSISLLTAFSLSAVATNTKVKGGGAYYLISRSLGMEFGGAIAIVFYLAQAIATAMYIIGFTEAIKQAFPAIPWSSQVIGTITNVVVFISVFVGAGWAIRLQFFILAVLALALVSFYVGAGLSFSTATFMSNLPANYEFDQSFFTMFALFFPAVTGIMAGANMSGDLRDPAAAIPKGTFGAIGVTTLVYLSIIVLLAGASTSETLIDNNFIMRDIAVSGTLIVAGVFAATLSSALGSMMGAPRILQAFAKDDIYPWLRFLGRGWGPNNEPRTAIVLTFLVTEAAVMLGDLDIIAPIITMFFIVTYGTLNLACFYEAYSRNPSYRPRFKFNHWTVSLAGAIGCAIVMLLIAPLWAIAAALTMVGLYKIIALSEVKTRWGDVKGGMAFERARRALLRLEEEEQHPKNWRPRMLALVAGKSSGYIAAEFGYWLGAGNGVLTLGQVISGAIGERLQRVKFAENSLREVIRSEGLAAFPCVVAEDDVVEGIKAMLQCHGIGGIRPNAIVLGWPRDISHAEQFGDMLRLTRQLGRSAIVIKCRPGHELWTVPAGNIEVWWRDRQHGPLMLILAHLLTQNREFRQHPIKVIQVVPHLAGRDSALGYMNNIIQGARIDATAEALVSGDLQSALGVRGSRDGIVFLPFEPPEKGAEKAFLDQYEAMGSKAHTMIMVSSAGGIDLDV
ncbi:amino acid permease [Emcibacter sp. SYSU 3D8]|uniref:amino acid permease n=1 Tax=Emcibacter sp. SYSU 3D8 TaxID=3133969 RepID=UPI0031FE8797